MSNVWNKDPDSVKDYKLNWSEWLSGDTIVSSSWVNTSGITIDSASHDNGIVTVWVSGGVSGTVAQSTNIITTAAGRTEDQIVYWVIENTNASGVPTLGYPPSSPFCTSSEVALLVYNLLGGNNDFNEIDTHPKKSTVDNVIRMIDSRIMLQFQQAGYVIPFQAATNEIWPAFQTQYLKLLSSVGTAAYIGGYVLKPAPAIQTGRGGSVDNVYQSQFDEHMRLIWDGRSTQTRFRANYYLGTPAEKAITEPGGPMLDITEGKSLKEDYIGLIQYTDLFYKVQRYVENVYGGDLLYNRLFEMFG